MKKSYNNHLYYTYNQHLIYNEVNQNALIVVHFKKN